MKIGIRRTTKPAPDEISLGRALLPIVIHQGTKILILHLVSRALRRAAEEQLRQQTE